MGIQAGGGGRSLEPGEWTSPRAYPCVVLPARYGGVYEGGAWVAFPCRFDEVPANAFADDVRAMCFWQSDERSPRSEPSPAAEVGRGASPNEAVMDMLRRALHNPDRFPRPRAPVDPSTPAQRPRKRR